MKVIRLRERTDHSPLYINPEAIAAVWSHTVLAPRGVIHPDEGTVIELVSGARHEVRESMSQVATALQEAGNEVFDT